MAESTESDGALASAGEAVGGVLSTIPDAIGSFFGGIGDGAGVHGPFDWITLVIGLALLLSTIRGFRRGRIVGPMLRGFFGVLLMGWAVT